MATTRTLSYANTTSMAHEARREGVSSALVVSLLVLFLALMSVFVFNHQSLRLDEAQSLWQTSRTTAKMIEIVAEDVHVPLYHLLLHFWQFIFGNSVEGARFLSLIFAMLSVPMIYLLGKITYNRSVGLFAALLLTISPFFNWYGSEIRMYSLFAFLTIVNQYFFMRILRDSSEGENLNIWWGYGASALLGMFTHYFFGLNLLTQFVFFLIYRSRFPTHSFRRFVTVAVVLAVCFAPWIYFVKSLGSASNTQPALTKPTTVNLFNTFSQFVFGFQDDHINTILVSLWPLSVLLVFLSMRKAQRVNPETVYMLLSVVVPILLVFAVSTTLKPIYLTRYLILSLPALYLVMSWIFSTYPAVLGRALKILLVLVMLSTLTVEAMSANTPVKENYREVANYLTTSVKPQDVVAVSAPFTVYPIEYYYRGNANLETLPMWNRFAVGPIPAFDENKLPEEVNTLKGDHQRLWLVLSYDQGYEEKIRLYMDTHYERIGHKAFSPGLNLYVYKLRYDDNYIEQIPGLINDQANNGSASTTPGTASSTATSTKIIRAVNDGFDTIKKSVIEGIKPRQ